MDLKRRLEEYSKIKSREDLIEHLKNNPNE